MGRNAIDSVRAEIGAAAAGKLPDLSAVPPEALEAFAVALREARRNQKAMLEKSAEDSLRLVPALLRPAVRRVLFG